VLARSNIGSVSKKCPENVKKNSLLVASCAGTPRKKSAENGLVQRSTDPNDVPSIDPRTVNGVRRSQVSP